MPLRLRQRIVVNIYGIIGQGAFERIIAWKCMHHSSAQKKLWLQHNASFFPQLVCPPQPAFSCHARLTPRTVSVSLVACARVSVSKRVVSSKIVVGFLTDTIPSYSSPRRHCNRCALCIISRTPMETFTEKIYRMALYSLCHQTVQ